MVICDCSAVQSAVRLAAAPVFLLGATRHFLLLSYKICALYGTFLRFFFYYSGCKISYSKYSFVTQIVISVIRIVSYTSERHVLYIYLTCE